MMGQQQTMAVAEKGGAALKRTILALIIAALMTAVMAGMAASAFAMPKQGACDIVIDKASVKGAYQSGCSKS